MSTSNTTMCSEVFYLLTVKSSSKWAGSCLLLSLIDMARPAEFESANSPSGGAFYPSLQSIT